MQQQNSEHAQISVAKRYLERIRKTKNKLAIKFIYFGLKVYIAILILRSKR